MQTVKLGDRVRIQYSRVPHSGAMPDVPHTPKVLEFTVGGDKVMPGLSFGIAGMNQGDKKRLTLQPVDAYGDVQGRLIREIPRGRIPDELELHVGKRLSALRGRTGARRRVRVVEIKPDSVIVDGNHPLAGKVIELEVYVLSVDSSSAANQQKPQFDLGGSG
ncbi:MAG: FKBP-type peptidyl-prolyl cis-trans isomerase [Pirellulaceae bacterium]|nr:FKBP-type peptidyl-prolyl cis-trans isomerase [Pirellulaceae bacterium]